MLATMCTPSPSFSSSHPKLCHQDQVSHSPPFLSRPPNRVFFLPFPSPPSYSSSSSSSSKSSSSVHSLSQKFKHFWREAPFLLPMQGGREGLLLPTAATILYGVFGIPSFLSILLCRVYCTLHTVYRSSFQWVNRREECRLAC